MDDDNADVSDVRVYLEAQIRLRASPAWQMDRQLFSYVIKHLPQGYGLDTLADMTYRSLRLIPRPQIAKRPLLSVLEVASSALRQEPPSRMAMRALPTLDQVANQLQIARLSLPDMHAEVVDACTRHALSLPIAALKLGLGESLLHRYHTQARALMRCHPWPRPLA